MNDLRTRILTSEVAFRILIVNGQVRGSVCSVLCRIGLVVFLGGFLGLSDRLGLLRQGWRMLTYCCDAEILKKMTEQWMFEVGVYLIDYNLRNLRV